MSHLIPKSWMPAGNLLRIVVHWSAGGYTPNHVDLAHYHIVVDGDGKLHRGDHAISQNASPRPPGARAAHVGGLNTGSIGISAACSGHQGHSPLRRVQWDTLILVAAELCEEYGLEPVERQVLQHGDVWRVYGEWQDGREDINRLPWDPSLSHDAVGHLFRDEVRRALDKNSKKNGGVFAGGERICDTLVVDNQTFIPVRPVLEHLGYSVHWDSETGAVHIKGGPGKKV